MRKENTSSASTTGERRLAGSGDGEGESGDDTNERLGEREWECGCGCVSCLLPLSRKSVLLLICSFFVNLNRRAHVRLGHRSVPRAVWAGWARGWPAR